MSSNAPYYITMLDNLSETEIEVVMFESTNGAPLLVLGADGSSPCIAARHSRLTNEGIQAQLRPSNDKEVGANTMGLCQTQVTFLNGPGKDIRVNPAVVKFEESAKTKDRAKGEVNINLANGNIGAAEIEQIKKQVKASALDRTTATGYMAACVTNYDDLRKAGLVPDQPEDVTELLHKYGASTPNYEHTLAGLDFATRAEVDFLLHPLKNIDKPAGTMTFFSLFPNDACRRLEELYPGLNVVRISKK